MGLQIHTHTHLHALTFLGLLNQYEREQERESIVFGEWQMDTEKCMGWTIRSVRETIWETKMWTCGKKTTQSLLDRVGDTHANTHMHMYLPTHTPVRVPVWKKDPSSHKKSQSERGENFLLLRVLAWKGAELLHIQRWFKFTDHV